MKNLLSMCVNQKFEQKKINLLDVNIILEYNCKNVFLSLYEIIRQHVSFVENDKTDFSFKMICDRNIFNYLYDLLEKTNVCRNDIVLSYCSHEKGTIRAQKYIFNDIEIVYSTKYKVAIILDYINQTYIYITDEQTKSKEKILYKFFEHILNKVANIKGTILVHAASVMHKGKAILFVGPKRSGKTTLFFDVLNILQSEPISFDKVHLKLEQGKIICYGLPSRLRALPGTLRKYGEFFNDLISEEFLTASIEKLWEGESRSKIDIPLEKFLEFSQSKSFVKRIEVGGIVIPNIAKDNIENVECVKMEQYNEILDLQTFTPDNPEEDWWTMIGKEHIQNMENTKKDIFRKIHNSVPVFKLSGSSDLKKQIRILDKKLI